MINRSKLKYQLKKMLPKHLFVLVHTLWQKLFLGMVEAVDKIRLRKFAKTELVHLTHRYGRFSLYICPENGFIDNYIFLYGVYESFMLDIMYTHLKKGMTFIDVGANIGQHSMYAATLVGSSGSVYAFEPIPRIYKQLTDSIAENHFSAFVHPKNTALGESNKEETLYVSSNAGGSSLVREDATVEQITVHVRRGDDELFFLPRIDMVKIDVEGYEYEVLAGMQETLKKHKPDILIEFSGAVYLAEGKKHGEKILSLLTSNDYVLCDIEDEMKVVADTELFLTEFVTGKKVQTNLLCVSRTKNEI
jgi:FkbM family methyltransferase